MTLKPENFKVRALGECKSPSPLALSRNWGDGLANFVPDDTRVLYNIFGEGPEAFDTELWMERAGPRECIYFDPETTRAAMVTCGGLSPGLNNVIRSLFLELHHQYQVADVIGFKYGFRGINPEHGNEPVRITPEFVRTIHNEGGSVLGTSRGKEDPGVIVDRLQDMAIDILFCIGGDGTLRGAHAIAEEAHARKLKLSVIGVPKTIDNDIAYVYKTFGFDTAVGVVRQAIDGAHVESVGAPNCVGLVKVMGRDAGFIAAYGTLASMEVNFCLIPEIRFDLEGEGGLLDRIEKRVRSRGHCVVVAAEGAGQHFFSEGQSEFDASGNRLQKDVGLLLKDAISSHMGKSGMEFNLKYIDPSYLIRSVKANASDAIFCNNLARAAVHAAMAGKTDVVIGLWHGVYVHVPVELVTSTHKRVHSESYLWRTVLGATGQPAEIRARRD